MFNQNDKKIGYIHISIFAMNTDTQFKEQLTKLEKDKIDSLIIDLRGNNGGHLSTVENMISMFLDKNNIIYQIENKSKITKYYSKGDKTKKYPIVVLIDSSSASASEMMAAALKESYGATLVGKTTYGKGTVQELQDNKDSQVGIKPDVEVELNKEYISNPINDNDNQLQKALEILKN